MQFTKLIWRDGQPYSSLFDDIYYSSGDSEAIPGESEFNHVFFKNNGMPERWQQRDDFVIAELGFGSGLNCVLTIKKWLQHCAESNKRKILHYIAIEKYPLSAATIGQLISGYPELRPVCDELVENYPPAIEATHSRSLFDGRVFVHFKFMDVNDALENERLEVDAWYLDGFSPAKNPEMWSQSIFEKIAKNSRNGATCSTYTAAGFVRRNLQSAGFVVDKVSGYGKKREMLVARLPATDLDNKKHSSPGYRDKPWFQLPPKIHASEKKATVIGAGIAGLSVAYALIQRGWSVTIIDKHDDVGRGTTSNPAPIVYPRLSVNNDIDTEYYTTAYCHALYVFNKLQKRSRQQFWYGDGLLQSMDKKRLGLILKKFDFNRDFISIVDDSDDGEVTVDYMSAGVLLPDILCAVIRGECGDKLDIIKAEITCIKNDGKQWQCYSEDKTISEDRVLVIASGIDINVFGLPINFPVDAVRGQVAVLEANDVSRQITKTLNADIHITPAINGRHYLGATYDRNSVDHAISLRDSHTLFESLNAIYPGMFSEDDYVDAWVGFRAISKDRVPVVGAVPDLCFYEKEYADIRDGNNIRGYLPASYMDGLYISAAHGSRGFTSSFISAEVIASMIEGTPFPVSKRVLDYLSPSRFVVNDLKRR